MQGLIKIKCRNEKPVIDGKYPVEYRGEIRTVNYNHKLGFFINHPGTWWKNPQRVKIRPRYWYKKVVIIKYLNYE